MEVLQFWLRNPSHKKNLKHLRQLAESGVDVPTLSHMPHLMEEASWLWQAFEILSEKRIILETGPQPIPVSEILAYSQYQGIEDEDRRDDLLRAISDMDRKWITEVRTQMDKARAAQKRAPVRGAARARRR